MLYDDTLIIRSATIDEEEQIALIVEIRLAEKSSKRQIFVSRIVLYGAAVLSLLFGIHGLLSGDFSERTVVYILCAIICFMIGGRAKMDARASIRYGIKRRMRKNPQSA